MTLPTVGFIGLGMMGRPMAAHLANGGWPLVVHDTTAAVVRDFTAACPGAVAAATLADFARCEVVVLMLPGSPAVDAVVLGRGGLAEMLPAGAIVIDMSSSEPMRSRALAQALQKTGRRFLDAPVSGGVKRAVDGSLAIMVGGDAALLEAHRQLFAAMGRSITHVGPVGAGHAMKALNNFVSAAGLVAAVEALHVGQRFGLDPAVMVDVLNGSTGRNNTTENKVKPFMLSGRFDSGFSLALMAKDLGIAAGLADALDMPMELGRDMSQRWTRANAELGPGADHTEMYRWLRPAC